MSEQLTSDVLSKLKSQAEHPAFKSHGYISVPPAVVLALVECAEAAVAWRDVGSRISEMRLALAASKLEAL